MMLFFSLFQNGLSWMNELMCGGEPSENSLLGRLVALGQRRSDSDEDPEAQLEDLIDTRGLLEAPHGL